MTPRLLTVPDVAAHLSVSPRTVKRVLARGDLPVVRVGRLVRVREDNLRRFMANRERRCSATTTRSSMSLRSPRESDYGTDRVQGLDKRVQIGDDQRMTTRQLRRVTRAAKAASNADAALSSAILAAYEAGATLREIASATNGRLRSPESIRAVLRKARL